MSVLKQVFATAYDEYGGEIRGSLTSVSLKTKLLGESRQVHR